MFNAFVYIEPVQTSENMVRSGRLLSCNNSTSKNILNILNSGFIASDSLVINGAIDVFTYLLTYLLKAI